MLNYQDERSTAHTNMGNFQLPNRFQTIAQKKSASAATLLAIVWAFVGLMLVLIYTPDEWAATVGVLMISQAFTGRLVWARFKATNAAVLPDFLTLVLFTQFGTKILTALGIIFGNEVISVSAIDDTLQNLETVALYYQFQAELVLFFGLVIFTSVWRMLEGKYILAVWDAPGSIAAWSTYAISLSIYVVLNGLNIDLGMSAELLHLFAVGAMAVLLGGTGEYALGKQKSAMAILALVPLMILAMRTGMKSEVALVMLPVLLPAFRRMSPGRFAFLGCFFLFVVLFLFPFNLAWREANWQEKRGDDIGEVASRVVASWEQVGFFDTAADSTARWLSRGSSSDTGGLVMLIAERDGLIGPVLIEGLTTIFVPRFLWPDKPTYAPGAWFTWYLGRAESPETAISSTAMMLSTELYWMFGLTGVLIGMSIISFLYFKVWRFLIQASITRPLPAVALFAMFARASGMEEIHTIYALTSPIILLVYVLIFDRFQRIFFPGLNFHSSTTRSG